jgi:hypothetical protein
MGIVASGIAVVHVITRIRRSHRSNPPLSYAAVAVTRPKAVDASNDLGRHAASSRSFSTVTARSTSRAAMVIWRGSTGSPAK